MSVDLNEMVQLRAGQSESAQVPRCLIQRMADVPPGYDWLSADERAVLDGQRFIKRRADWRLGRWTAKRCLYRSAGDFSEPFQFADIEIRAAADGAPEAFIGGTPATLALSISHSAGLGFAVVAPLGSSVGCDVEHIEPRSRDFVEDYFTVRERQLVRESLPTERALLTTLIWSAKESALKTLRRGLRADTREVEVSLTGSPHTGGHWAPLSVRGTGLSQRICGWWRCTGNSIFTVTAGALAKPLDTADAAKEIAGIDADIGFDYD